MQNSYPVVIYKPAVCCVKQMASIQQHCSLTTCTTLLQVPVGLSSALAQLGLGEKADVFISAKLMRTTADADGELGKWLCSAAIMLLPWHVLSDYSTQCCQCAMHVLQHAVRVPPTCSSLATNMQRLCHRLLCLILVADVDVVLPPMTCRAGPCCAHS